MSVRLHIHARGFPPPSDRFLIYGASRDTVALSRILVNGQADVDIVHPSPIPESLLLELPPSRYDVSVLEESDDSQAALPYRTLFVDASYSQIPAPDSLSYVIRARRAGVPISSVGAYVLDHAAAATIAVTGSGGKTTTASLVAHMLRSCGRTVHVATDPAPSTNLCPNYEILNALPRMSDADFVVCELTSVYLSYMKTSPKIAVITNLWPEHLEWHGTMQAYVTAKQTILRYQGSDDWAIMNSDDQLVHEHFEPVCRGRVAYFGLKDPGQSNCVFVTNGSIRARWNGKERDIVSTERLSVEYAFIGNALAAVAAVEAAGIESPLVGRALETFPGVHLRREFVGEVGGVRVINDGMAGSPVKVRVGLETFTDKSVVLIAGGAATFPTEVLHSSSEARAQLEDLGGVISRKTVAVILFGEGGSILRQLLIRQGYTEEALVEAEDLCDATAKAAYVAEKGAVVVFAPLFNVPRELRSEFAPTCLEACMPLVTGFEKRAGLTMTGGSRW